MFKNRSPSKKGFASIMVQLFTTIAVFYGALMLIMFLAQRSFLYHPAAATLSPVQSGVGDMQEITITTEDGLKLFAWAQPPADKTKPWVVVFHGNTGTLGERGNRGRAFLGADYGVLMVEYRGFSGNPGQPSETGLMLDGRAALAYLADQGAVGQNLILYGESLGTAVAVAMAEEQAKSGQAVAAVILEAPFTSMVDAGGVHYPYLPVSFLLKDRYDSLSRIKAIAAPVFIVHGDQDFTVPQDQGRRLFDAALEPKTSLWIAGAHHGNLFTASTFASMTAFLDAQP